MSITQYVYASVGLALAVTVLIYLKTGAALMALGVGVLFGAASRTWC